MIEFIKENALLLGIVTGVCFGSLIDLVSYIVTNRIEARKKRRQSRVIKEFMKM